MKKIVLGCAAVLLSLGLLAGCNNNDVDDKIDNTGPEEGGTGDDGEGEPSVVGSGYLFGFENDSKLYAITGDTVEYEGEKQSYEGAYTEDHTKAADVAVEQDETDNSKYYLSFEYEGAEYWVTTVLNEEHHNLAYSTTKAEVYLHEDGETEYFGDESGEYFIGFNSVYDCVYLSKVSSYIASSPVCGVYTYEGELLLGGKGGEVSNPNINTNPTYTGSETIPEVGDATTYELEVGTGTIVKNCKRSDGKDFVVGANSGVTEDELDGETLKFADVFTIAFVHSESGNDTSSRLWGEGIRVYTGNYFTVSTLTDWELTSVAIEYASADANTEYPVITGSDGTTLATGLATSGSSTYTTVTAGSSDSSLSSSSSCTSVTATVTRSDGDTKGNLRIKTITVNCAKTTADNQPS